jgi:threonine dehydrogenase-like Zn-dependent dehydrogenase
MKAAVFYEAEDLRLEDVPEPEADADEVVVEVLACGFCGSDVEYFYGKSPLGTADGKGPLVLGHEVCGRVVQAGKLASSYGLEEGDRVAINPVQSCNSCNWCRAGKLQFCPNGSTLGVTSNGGFAQFAKTKIAHAYKLPDSLTDEQGAFVEMLSSAVYAVHRADVEPGNFAVVYGPGPVGLAMVQLLRNEGARVAIVGTRDYRLDLALGMGADFAFNIRDTGSPYYVESLTKAIEDANGGLLADRVLVATATVEANQQAIEISGPASVVVLMGLAGPEDAISVPLLANLYLDKTIRFSLLYPLQWPTTIRLLQDKKIDTSKIITHSATLDGIAPAIERVLNREDEVIKTVIKPGS